MKKSGYRSYHIIIYYNVETLHGTKELQVEIQIRTLAMNFGQQLNIHCNINIKRTSLHILGKDYLLQQML